MDNEALVDPEDTYAIGDKVVEMAERVRVGHKCVPGAQATWGFEMDGTRYKVVVTVA